MLSEDAVAILVPSGDHTTSKTTCPESVNVNNMLPLMLLHTRVVPSEDAVAIFVPSGDHATDWIELLCPVSVNNVLPLLLLQTRAV